MKNNHALNWATACFDDSTTEASYQASVHDRHFRSNAWGVVIGIAFISVYSFAEFIASHNPTFGVQVRVATVVLSGFVLAFMLNKRFARHHDVATVIVFTLMGIATNLNIWHQPNLDNSFFLGLIQGYIVFTLLLRLNFVSILFIISFTQISFMAIVFGKGDPNTALLQSADTLVIAVICGVGAYLLQRYQRADFLKNQLIEKQNTQLKGLLRVAEKDNQRKVAAMNMLVHFVKTPLHQINGFSDIVMNNLSNEHDERSLEQSVEGAQYIKNATADLSNSVNKLLTYHRLDEVSGQHEDESISLNSVVRDFGESLVASIEFSHSGEAGKIKSQREILTTAFASLAEYYSGEDMAVSSITTTVENSANGAQVSVTDDGPSISTEDFDEHTKPLTKFDKYLTCSGSELPMLLRTVARAIEITGGRFERVHADAGNRFVISIPDRELAESENQVA